MHLLMFDIDGTLIESTDFDGQCYLQAVREVLGKSIHANWSTYRHVTDAGILKEVLEREQLHQNTEEMIQHVKQRFQKKIQSYLSINAIHPILGAKEFIHELQQEKNVALSIATGG